MRFFCWLLIFSLGVASTESVGESDIRLKKKIMIATDVVRLSDLLEGFEHHGENRPLFQAPAPGRKGRIKIANIMAAAKEVGVHLKSQTPKGSVIVYRSLVSSPSVSKVLQKIQETLQTYFHSKDVVFSQETPLSEFIKKAPPFTRVSARVDAYDAVSENIRLSLLTQAPEMILKIKGKAAVKKRVPMLTAPLRRGEIIQSHDVALFPLSIGTLKSGTITDASHLIGKQIRRLVKAHAPLQEKDVVEPMFVERNQIVRAHYQTRLISLSLHGKALSAGRKGEIISINNLQSNHTFEAVVTAPGKVTVLSTHPAASPRAPRRP